MQELKKDLLKLQSELNKKNKKQLNQYEKVVRMTKEECQKLAAENK